MERRDFYEEQERQRLEQCGASRPRHTSRSLKEKLLIEKTINPTEPEARIHKRPRKPTEPHYLNHQSVNPAHGIVVNVVVTVGNGNDSGGSNQHNSL